MSLMVVTADYKFHHKGNCQNEINIEMQESYLN